MQARSRDLQISDKPNRKSAGDGTWNPQCCASPCHDDRTLGRNATSIRRRREFIRAPAKRLATQGLAASEISIELIAELIGVQ
jgi:hypothetical protein